MIALLLSAALGSVAYGTGEHVRVHLTTGLDGVRPIDSGHVALVFTTDPGWHLYWINPGDAGLPTEVTWEPGPGLLVGSTIYPVPERIEAPPLVTFGYHDSLVLAAPFVAHLPAGLDTATLSARVSWVVCKELCIPGQAELSIRLPRKTNPGFLSDASRIDSWLARTPHALPTLQSFAFASPESLVVQFRWDSTTIPGGSLDLFLAQPGVVAAASIPKLNAFEEGIEFRVARDPIYMASADTLTGLLVARGGWGNPMVTAVSFTAPVASGAYPSLPHMDSSEPSSSLHAGIGLLTALALAFIGGVLLNLMPCVLPVLSLKLLELAQLRNERPTKALGHAGLYCVGIFISFLGLAGVLLALRAGGEAVGWGFHLQSPVLLVGLCAFLTLVAANLAGLFEVGTLLPRLVGKTGSGSSPFLTGVLAVVVAAPCTAPFMGAALGWALVQPPVPALLVFTALGLGLASPFVIVAAVPGARRLLPRPGEWMTMFRQFLSFPMLATVGWLLWVLAAAGGGDAAFAGFLAAWAAGLSAWILGQTTAPHHARSRQIVGRALAVVVLVGVLIPAGLLARSASEAHVTESVRESGIDWVPATAERIDSALAAGTPVFLDFTAAWCLSCRANESTTLSHPDVVRAMNLSGVLPLRGDWTKRDTLITALLARYGRQSVPVYVLQRSPHDFELLPEVLTVPRVLTALSTANTPESGL